MSPIRVLLADDHAVLRDSLAAFLALYDDIDNQLHSRARLLIESGSLAADPGKAIEGTAYSDVNAMLVNPGRSIYTANQQGQTLPLGDAEKDVISGELLLSLRDKGNTVLVVEHKPEMIAIGDQVVDLGPRAGTAGGEICYQGTLQGPVSYTHLTLPTIPPV